MTTSKKAPSTKKQPTKKSSTSQGSPTMHSFVRYKDTSPFKSFQLTSQTVYWLILCALILALGLWVISLNVRVQQIYDQAQYTAASTPYLSTPLKR